MSKNIPDYQGTKGGLTYAVYANPSGDYIMLYITRRVGKKRQLVQKLRLKHVKRKKPRPPIVGVERKLDEIFK